jgi:sugar (pentulose or hexulose) kinase
VTPQIVADVTDLPLRCVSAREASLLGAAIIARGLLEPGMSLGDLVNEMAPLPQVVEPGADAPFYQEQYQRYVRALPGHESNRP